VLVRLQPVLIIVLLLVVFEMGGARASWPTPLVSAAPVPNVKLSHVVVIVMEDEGVGNICAGSPPPCKGTLTPYMSGLANTYGVASQYVALYHESLPNYIALLGGDTFGCNNACPPLNHTNIIDRLEAAGLTWRAYMEDYSGGCSGTNLGHYASDHNPFVQFADILNNTERCNRIVNPGPDDSTLIDDLGSNATAPNLIWLTPNLCNDMHDECNEVPRIQSGDSYLAGLVPQILNSAVFKTTNSTIFITFDEGNGYCPLNQNSEDCVYTVWAGPTTRRSYASTLLYNHYSFLATIERVWVLTPLTANDAAAAPMIEFFGGNNTTPSVLWVLVQASVFAVPVAVALIATIMLRKRRKASNTAATFQIAQTRPASN
jgi:phosphatidylinositol-3-phosphatase